jgi:hypothetical protein
MTIKRVLEYGGIVAGAVLIVFGAVSIYMGVDARSTVRDSIKQEQIFFSDASDPAVAKYAPDWAGEQVTNGTQARAQAQIMREHTLSGSDPDGPGPKPGLTYAQMGRYKAIDAKGDDMLGGTNDAAKAVLDEATGQPVSNPRRGLWVTETALSTALNMSYMAENLALFSLVVGTALLLTGIGLLVLALAVFGRALAEAPAAARAGKAAPAAG